jgi:4-hydroxy-tetrahydrodipicolinate reductase
MIILISGYGKMGHEIAALAEKNGHVLAGAYNQPSDWDNFPEKLMACDTVIDFSQPNVAVSNILRCFEAKKPIVTGTTGWYDKLPEVEIKCLEMEGALFYAPNFSPGMNIFLEASERLATLMRKQSGYTPGITEIHHTRKLDAPSGTAIALAERILGKLANHTSWTTHAEPLPHEIPVTSIREGDVTGTHILEFRSAADRIVFTHEAFNRSGFAGGALLAAEWLKGRKGIYTMKDLLGF